MQRQRARGLRAGTRLPRIAPPAPEESLALRRQHLGAAGLLAEAALPRPAPGGSMALISGKEAEQPSRPLCFPRVFLSDSEDGIAVCKHLKVIRGPAVCQVPTQETAETKRCLHRGPGTCHVLMSGYNNI